MVSRNTSPARFTRRDALRTSMTVGAGAVAASGLAACGSSVEDRSVRGAIQISDDSDNPFGVDGSVPLSVTIFKGGYSDEYATEGHEKAYKKKFPDTLIKHTGTQQIAEVVRPQLDAFAPPDVLMNAGSQFIETETLVDDGQLMDLQPLLDAPSIDDPKTSVKDTMRDSAVKAGQIGDGDEIWALEYDFAGYGLWYSGRLFEQNDWDIPESWPEFMDLARKIKKKGIAPFIHQGMYPTYILDPLVNLAVRHGGSEVQERLNRKCDKKAWSHPSIRKAAEAWEEFVDMDYVMKDSHKFTHRKAQKLWVEGEAAFIPSGSWLENEEKELLTPEFDMKFLPIPPLEGSKSPKMVQATPGQNFVIPRYAKNPAGALEYMRIMLSKAGTQSWVDYTASLNAAAESTVKSKNPGVVSLSKYLSDEKYLYSSTFGTSFSQFAQNILYPELTRLFRGKDSAGDFIDALIEGLEDS